MAIVRSRVETSNRDSANVRQSFRLCSGQNVQWCHFNQRTMPGSDPTPVKGQPVTFVRGKYEGCHGWKDASKKQPPKMTYVIVATDGSELPTRVRNTSLGPPPAPPATYEEAALQQLPEIANHLRQAAALLAKCGVEDWSAVAGIMEAIGQQEEAKLKSLGPRARYFAVDYNDESS